jgi:hypothetical protein
MTRQQQVAAALVRLDGWIPANHIKSKAEVADEHAKFIEWAMRGIKGKSRGGPARALRDLSAATRKAIARKDAAGWARAWAECPRRTRWLILAQHVEHCRWRDYSPMPDAETALREIAFAVKHLSSVPVSERRRRTHVAAERDAVAAIRSAFWELSDRKGKRIIGRDGQITGPLAELCREIDRIFETHLFSGTDCWRLR